MRKMQFISCRVVFACYFWRMEYYEVDPLLKKLGKDRHWLASVTHYTHRTISVMLSAKGEKSRTPRAMSLVIEAIRMEEARQAAPVEIAPVQTLVLQPSIEEFRRWNRASMQANLLVADWTAKALNSYCQGVPLSSRVAANETAYRVEPKE